MRLNGWQRLWVVFVVVWTFLVGGVTRQMWPVPLIYLNPTTGEPLSAIYLDPATGTPLRTANASPLPAVFYRDALAAYGVVPPVGADVSDSFQQTAPGAVVEIPNVGTVGFPSTMDKDRIEAICAQLVALHDGRQTKQRADLHANRVRSLCWAVGLWLCAPLVLYGLGWSSGWVYRGFAKFDRGK